MLRENSPTLLVVDDDAPILAMLEAFLEGRLECVVLTATNGADALKLVRDHDISLILTDIVMPGMSGTELVRQARLLRPNLRACFISGYSDEYEDDAQGTPFIQKPFNLARLLTLIREMLEPAESPTPASV